MATVATDRRPRTAGGPPLRRGSGRAVLDGNELIVKGALEAGVSLVTGYPGSPVAEVFSICEAHAPYLAELGVEAQLANNEAQSAAMLNGARQVPGARGMAVMKSVGAYVALDGLAIANAALPAAGAAAVVVVGDDPALSSTQVGADSRLTLAGARMPVLEPASAQELKDLVRLAFDLSAESELVVGLVCTTPQADGAGIVELAPNRPPEVGPLRRVALDTAAVRPADTVSLPPQATSLEADIIERRVPRLHAAVRAAGLDRIERPDGLGHARVGVVTAGASYVLLRSALAELGIDGRVPVLRAGAHLADRPAPGATLRRRGGRAGGDGGAGAAPRGPGAARGRGATAGGVGEAPAGRGPRVPRGRGDGSRHRPGGPRAAGAGAAGRLPARGRRARPRRRRAALGARRARAPGDAAHAHLLRRLPAPGHQLADDRDPAPPGRPGLHAPRPRPRAGQRDRPRRHRLLLDGGHAPLRGDARPLGDGPRRRDRRGLGAPGDQPALRAGGGRHLLPRRDVHDGQRDQAAAGHPLHRPRQQEHGDDRPPGDAGERDRPDGPPPDAARDRADHRGDGALVPRAAPTRTTATATWT